MNYRFEKLLQVGLRIALPLLSLVGTAGATAEWSNLPYRVSAPGTFVREAPILLSDSYEKVHMFWVEQSKLPGECIPGDPSCYNVLRYACFEGSTWQGPVDVANASTSRIYTLTVAIDREQTLYAAWVQSPGNALRGEIMMATAPLNGALDPSNWSIPTAVPIDEPNTNAIILRADATGTLHLIFSQPADSNPPVPGSLFYSRSQDTGSSWSTPSLLEAVPENRKVGLVHFETDSQSGLHVLWHYYDQDNEGKKISYIHSLDGGGNWSRPFTIDELIDDDLLNKSVRLPYGFVVKDQNVHVIWVGGPPGGPVGVGRKHRYSTDRGVNWSDTSTNIFDLWGSQNGDGAAADSMGRIHWVSNARSLEILKDGLWNSTWSNGEWSEPQQIFSETTDNTRLAATESGRLVAAFRQTTTNVNWDAVFAMNTASRTFYFPHYADFGGEPSVSMLFAINNLSSGQASGKLVVYANDGKLQTLNFEGIGPRSELDLNIEPNSTAVFRTIGDPVLLKTGYISVELDQPDVSGVAIFKYAAGPEASVLPAEPGRRFALYVEKSAALSTGIAFARLTPEQPLTLRLYELDGSLREEVTDYTMSGPQEAKFVEQFFTDVPDEFTGLMVVESEALFACVGLRFGGGILSTIPVSDLDAVEAQPIFFFPHYGDGSGLSTSFVINNLLGESVEGQISFFDPAGNPRQMPLEGEPPANQIALDLDAKASRVLKTDGSTSGNPLVGYSAVELDQPGASGVAIFKYASGPEASVLPSYPGKKFSLFAEVSAALDTGFAIARSGTDDVVLSLYDKSGALIGTESAPFDGSNLHLARFLSQIFTVPLGFQGLLVMESEGDFSTIGLRFGGGVLSTIPVTPLQAVE